MRISKIENNPTFNAQLKLQKTFVTDKSCRKCIDLTAEQIKKLEEKCARIGKVEDKISINIFRGDCNSPYQGWISYSVPNLGFSGKWFVPPTFENIVKEIDSFCPKEAQTLNSMRK